MSTAAATTDELLDDIEDLDGVVQLWRDPDAVDPETGEVTRRWIGQVFQRGVEPWVRRRFYGDSRHEVLEQIRDALSRGSAQEQTT